MFWHIRKFLILSIPWPIMFIILRRKGWSKYRDKRYRGTGSLWKENKEENEALVPYAVARRRAFSRWV